MKVTKEHLSSGRTIDEAIENGIAEIGLDRDNVSVEVISTPKKGFLGIGSVSAQVKLSYEVDMPDLPPEPKPEPKPTPKPAPKAEPKQAPKLAPKVEPKQAPKVAPKTETKPMPKAEQKPSQKPVAPKPAASKPPRKQEGEGRKNATTALLDRPKEDFSPVEGTVAQNFLTELFKVMNLEVSVKAAAYENVLRIDVEGENMGLMIGRRGETLDALQYLTNLVVNRGEDEYTKVSLDIEDYRAKREESLIALANKMAAKVVKNSRSFTLEPMNPYERRIIHSALQNYAGVETSSTGYEPLRRIVISPEGQAPRFNKGKRPYQGQRRKPSAPKAESKSEE